MKKEYIKKKFLNTEQKKYTLSRNMKIGAVALGIYFAGMATFATSQYLLSNNPELHRPEHIIIRDVNDDGIKDFIFPEKNGNTIYLADKDTATRIDILQEKQRKSIEEKIHEK
jgi:hypothetical protein